MPIVGRSYVSGKLTGVWIRSPSGLKFVRSTDAIGPVVSISSPPASRASPSRWPAGTVDRTMSATSGPRPFESFARWDHASRSWRTFQVSLLTNTLEPFSESWPNQGSMQSGWCWERTTAVPRTGGSGSGYSLPTPTAPGRHQVGKIQEWGGSKNPLRVPSPGAGDYRMAGQPGHRRGQLNDPAMGIVPVGGRLNPTWVEWLMGWPLGWTDLEPLAMDRWRLWLSEHS